MITTNTPNVGIIGGAGTMGSRLLERLASVGYRVHVFDSNATVHPETQLPNTSIHASVESAVDASEILILAVPYVVEQEIAERIGAIVGNRIVVSITNPLTLTLDDVVTPHDESAAEHLCALMPHARVVKAFNSLSAAAFDVPHTSPPVFDTFVASDHRDAAHVVEEMIRAMGFRPWYVGGLILSRTLERMSALLIGVSQRYSLEGALGWKIVQVVEQRDRGKEDVKAL